MLTLQFGLNPTTLQPNDSSQLSPADCAKRSAAPRRGAGRARSLFALVVFPSQNPPQQAAQTAGPGAGLNLFGLFLTDQKVDKNLDVSLSFLSAFQRARCAKSVGPAMLFYCFSLSEMAHLFSPFWRPKVDPGPQQKPTV